MIHTPFISPSLRRKYWRKWPSFSQFPNQVIYVYHFFNLVDALLLALFYRFVQYESEYIINRLYEDQENCKLWDNKLESCIKFSKLMRTMQNYKYFTAPFNNMWTLKFKAQPKNAFFTIINQMFRSPSQLLSTAELLVIKSNQTKPLSTVQTT